MKYSTERESLYHALALLSFIQFSFLLCVVKSLLIIVKHVSNVLKYFLMCQKIKILKIQNAASVYQAREVKACR